MAALDDDGGDELLLGGDGERARGGRGARGEWGKREGDEGECVALVDDVLGVGRSRRWPACGCGRRPCASRPPGERRGMTGGS